MSYYLLKSLLMTEDRIEIYLFHFKHNFFKNSFFSYVIIEYNNLCKSIWNSKSLSVFKKKYPEIYTRPSPNSTYNCLNIKGIKHLTRLRLGLRHVRYHEFKHDFLDSLNPICSCRFDIETTSHLLLHCPNLINERSLLLSNISRLSKDKLPSRDTSVIKRLL